MKKPKIMGIFNVTPDYFSDGGSFFDEQSILRQAERLLAAPVSLKQRGISFPGLQPIFSTACQKNQRKTAALCFVRSISTWRGSL